MTIILNNVWRKDVPLAWLASGACWVVALAIVLGGSIVGAQTAGTEGNLSLGMGSRGIALGGAYTARLEDASAVFWNPASTSGWERGQVSVMHAPIGFGDASRTAFGAAYPTLRAGSCGFGLTLLGTDGIESTDASGRPLGTIGFAETSAGILEGRVVNPIAEAVGRKVFVESARIFAVALGERTGE